MKKNNIIDVTVRVCLVILILFMISVMARFLSRQILVEILGWDNAFTKFVFWDAEAMNDVPGIEDENGEITVNINWEEKYPFSNEDEVTVTNIRFPIVNKYITTVVSAESKIETYTEDLLMGHMYFTRAGKKYNVLIGCVDMPMNSDSDADQIIILNNGYLTYTEKAVEDDEIERLSSNVADFSDYLAENNIGFLYANAGSKVCRIDKQLPEGAVENSNENADALLNSLKKKGVSTLDYRPLQEEQYSDWYSSYYITDHHWKNSTGLWAAGVLAEYLNENEGFDFKPDYFDEENYIIDTTNDYFLGGQGRTLTTAVADLEPFSRIVPKFDTDFSIQILSRGIDKRGKYEETLFRDEFYKSISDYTLADFEEKEDTYHSVSWRNDALGTVKNNLCKDNSGKRILMIQDSFGWYLSTYLATDVPEIDYIYLYGFTGSVKKYIEETKPNMVVLLLCEGNIRPITESDYKEHKHFFDFR